MVHDAAEIATTTTTLPSDASGQLPLAISDPVPLNRENSPTPDRLMARALIHVGFSKLSLEPSDAEHVVEETYRLIATRDWLLAAVEDLL